jgi:hypothetical protein
MANDRLQWSSPLVPGLPLVALRTLAVQGSITESLGRAQKSAGMLLGILPHLENLNGAEQARRPKR